ncbi:penicillin-binding protein 2 [bacterium]|nr:penicillin-binding protein 2 [bacterium]MBU1753726.1 penicillin-binding protein 2 [bacterium]
MIQQQQSDTEIGFLKQRLMTIAMMVLLLFGILMLRIGYLQIIKGGYFRNISENNRIRLIPITASRGMIFDRNGEILAIDEPSFDISIIQLGLHKDDIEQSLLNLSRLLDIDIEKARNNIKKKHNRPFEPAVIVSDVDRITLAKVAERTPNLPGVIIQVTPKRNYLYGELCAHVLGYLGEINQKELRVRKNYKSGEWIGKSGIESVYDSYLKGTNGGKQIEVDVRGRQLQVLGMKEPMPGNNLFLSIDLKMQQIAYDALENNCGAVVVVNPQNGELLACVSKPSFDTNMFLHRMSGSQAAALFADPRHPLLNRTIQAQYSPGSVFKIVVATAALENNVICTEDTIECSGVYEIGKQKFTCFQRERHGVIGFINAITLSCNVYFYQLGYKLGVSRINEFAKKFGFGKPTGIDLLSEKTGLIPTPAWKKRIFETDWYTGDTINLSIGQGYALVTPLQMANLLAIVANGGRVYRPHLAIKMVSSSGKIVNFNPDILDIVPISAKTKDILHASLESAVLRGTGQKAMIWDMRVAGKTGTAQNPQGDDHAWFVCFAPVEDPRVAIAVIVEHGGKGGAISAPIARKILQYIKISSMRDKESVNTQTTKTEIKPDAAQDVMQGTASDVPQAEKNPAEKANSSKT